MKPDVKLGQAFSEEMKRMVIDVARRQLSGISDRVTFVRPGEEVVTGVTAVEAFGHSAGMLAMNIASGSDSLFYAADTFMHAAINIEYPAWQVGLDSDRKQAALTRQRLLDRVTAEKSLVLAPHFPFPGIGHVAKFGQSYKWEPVVWEW